MSIEYKIIFLYFKKYCTLKEISDILNLNVRFVAETISVELCETKRQSLNMVYYTPREYSGKVKLNQHKKDDL
jgi:hypothetical protein